MERDSLLQDYEEAVQKQAVLLTRQQATIDSLQEEVTAERHRAETIGKQLQTRLDSLLQQAKVATSQDSSEEISLLKQELESALKEKEASQAEGQRKALEVQRLHQALLASQGSHIPYKECEEYVKVVEALEEETLRLRTQAANTEEEKVLILKANHDLKKEVSTLRLALEEERQNSQVLRSELQEREASLQETKESFTALNQKFLEQSEDLGILLTQVQSLKGNRDHLAKVLMSVKERLKEAQERVAESVRVAEDSLVEKDAALLREKHALNEIQRLKGTVASLTEEAGRKAQMEVSKVKDDYNANIKKVSQEVARLEMTLSEKQLECDRGQKELRKVTEEAEQLQEEMKHRREHHQQEVLNLHQRINTLEARLTTLTAERDNMSSLGLQSAKKVEEQREDLMARIGELEARLSSARSECAGARLKAEETESSLAHVTLQLEKLREESDNTHKFLKRQLRLKMEEVEELTSHAEVRLEATESSHRETLAQCYQNTAALQDNCSRLQTQIKEQKLEYEQRVHELSCRLQETQDLQQQTAHSLHEANTNLAVMQDLTAQYKARITEVEERLHTAERRFLTLKKQNICDGVASKTL